MGITRAIARYVAVLLVAGLTIAPLGSAPAAGWSRHAGEVASVPAGVTRAAPMTGIHAAATATWRAQAGYTPTWVRSTGWLLIDTDLNAAYWSTTLIANPQVTWAISGTYPSARFVSVEANSTNGAPLAALADKDFPPNPGSVNPFAAGTQRGIGTYTLHVVIGAPPSPPVPGTLYVNVPAGTSVVLAYRVYLPDTGASPSGNVPLPVFYIPPGGAMSRAAPSTVKHATAWRARRLGAPASHRPRDRAGTMPALPQRTAADADAAASPEQGAASAGPMQPSAVISATPYIRFGGSGIFSNAYEAYLLGTLPVTTTLLYVLRFTAPSTPLTLAGEPLDLGTQLRYWSVCVYKVNLLPYACRADEQIPHGPQGQIIVVMGLPSRRPSNATAANGVAWIGLKAGVITSDILVRNLLPAADFTMSIFAVPEGDTPGPYMGPYAPVAVTCSTADFELNECAAPAGKTARR